MNANSKNGAKLYIVIRTAKFFCIKKHFNFAYYAFPPTLGHKKSRRDRRPFINWWFRSFLDEFVTYPFDGDDIVLTDFFADLADVNVDCAVTDHQTVAPYQAEDILTGEDFVGL